MIKKLIVTLAIIGLAATGVFAQQKPVDSNNQSTGYYVSASQRGAKT